MGDDNSVSQDVILLEDGAKLNVFIKIADPESPIVMIWPAMGVAARHYRRFMIELAEQGLTSIVVDFRGFGASTPATDATSTANYHSMASVDFPHVVDYLEQHFPGRQIVLLGHSLGGQIGLMYSALADGKLAGIALVASSTPNFRVYPGVSALAPFVGTAVVAGIARVVGYFPGDKLGRLGRLGRQPQPLMADWSRLAHTGRFDAVGSGIPYQTLMLDVRLPVLAVSFDGDWMAPPAAVDALCANIPNAKITRWHCDSSLTGGRPAGHISWINKGQSVAARIAEWVKQEGI